MSVSLRIPLSDYGIDSASSITTDVVESQILRLSLADSAACFLELKFPCRVEDDTVTARFKTKTGILVVTAQPAAVHGEAAEQEALFHGEAVGSHEGESLAQPGTSAARGEGHISPSQHESPGSGADDANLMREFADEAYLVSLALEDRAAATSAADKEEPVSGSRSLQPAQGIIADQHVVISSPAQHVDSKSTLPSPGGSAPVAQARANGEDPVELADGIDGSGLSAALGFSFSAGPAAAPAGAALPRVNAKKMKKRKAAGGVLEPKLKLLADSLQTRGFLVCDDFIPASAIGQVREELKQMENHYTPGEIWVGKDADVGAQITVNDVRGDSVLWMDEQALTATAFIKNGKKQACSFSTLHQVVQAVDALIMRELPRLVPDLANVSSGGRSDAMLAVYPGQGSRFAKHIDNSANDGRRLTCLCYLNNGWRSSMGGCLRLFSPGQAPVDVLPLGGRIACFWSKSVAHEVRPTHAPRHSFTLWYYDALEKAEALATAKVAAGGGTSAAAQAQARSLIRDILAQDVITPTEEGCRILAQRVKAMTASALSIVAGVVGAQTVQDFVLAASNITPEGLGILRDEIGRMGLQNHAPEAAA